MRVALFVTCFDDTVSPTPAGPPSPPTPGVVPGLVAAHAGLVVSAREEALGRIRAALADVPDGKQTPIPRDYARTRTQPGGTVERFCERVADYRATVERVSAEGLAEAVAVALLGSARVAVPTGLPASWSALTGVELVDDYAGSPLSVADLDAVDAVLTGCVVAVAETGTIVLQTGPLCGRRALSLVPDVHVCVVQAHDVVDDVPAAITRLRPDLPLTWVSGPRTPATSSWTGSRACTGHAPCT